MEATAKQTHNQTESRKVEQLGWSKRVQLGIVDNLIWVIIVAVFIVFSLTLPSFFTWLNIRFILYVAAPIGMLVFAESVVLISGNMDLSVARNAGLTSMLVGMIMVQWLPFLPGWVGVPLEFVVGAALGAFNGFFVGYLEINPFLMTLSTFLMYDWLTYFIRAGAIVNVPAAMLFLGGNDTLGTIHVAVYVLAVMCALLIYVLNQTRFGGYIKAMGGSPDAARMLGINLKAMNFWVFTIAGALAGLCGLLYIGYLQSIPSTIATGDDIFLAFAGAIIGGVSLRGGEGSLLGALGGILLIGIINAGTTMTSMDPALRGVLDGAILLVAILINKSRVRLRDRILMPG
jgi:ribose/xylose/arabinose/galactoside ABC-type transport system permease subunit